MSAGDTGFWRGISVGSSVSRDCKPVGGEDMTGKSMEGRKVWGDII